MATNVAMVLRNTRRNCALAKSVRAVLKRIGLRQDDNQSLASPETSSAELYRGYDAGQSVAPSAAHTALLYLGNDVGQGFAGDLGLVRCLARTLERQRLVKVLTVHPRSRHEAACIVDTQDAFFLHIFCDDDLLLVEAHAEKRTHEADDRLYCHNVAEKLVHWLDEGSLRGGIRSGTHLNMTRGLNGTVVSGVITGGSKEPLGSVV
jgi:hypothetical protein